MAKHKVIHEKRGLPLRIALVVPYLEPGGVETFLFRLGGYLKVIGYDVDIVATETKGRWWDKAEHAGIKAFISPINGTYGLIHAIKVGKFLSRGNYDVVLLNHARYAQASIGMLRDKTLVIPVIHNDVEEVYTVGCANQHAWNVAVAVSQRVQNGVMQYVPKRPVVVIEHGIEMPTEEAWKGRSAWSGDNEFKLLYVGAILHIQKGVYFLPRILKGCLDLGVNATLRIVGDGPDKDELNRIVKQHHVEENVRYSNFIPPEEIYDLMLSHHVLLMPSFYEGLGIVNLEAQACGCVPIASDLKDITDKTINNGTTGFLITVADTEEFVRRIELLYKHPNLWSAMSASGHKWIQQNYTCDKMGRAYVDLFEKGLKGAYPLSRSRRAMLPIDIRMFSLRRFLKRIMCR